MKFTLIYDSAVEEQFRTEVLPLIGDLYEKRVPYKKELLKEEPEDSEILLYLSDQQLKELLPELAKAGKKVAILPHPEAKQVCKGMGVDEKLKKAVAQLRRGDKPVKTDLLYCNGIPIFNKIIVGQAFKITKQRLPADTGFWKRNFGVIGRFINMRPFRVDINLKDERIIKTAVAGIVIPEHRKSSLISKMVLENTEINDGKMHSFLISPRSLLELIKFGITSIWKRNKLPPFAAHIKTSKIEFSFPGGPQLILVDGEMITTEKLSLTIGEEQLEIYPGKHLDLPEANPETTDVIKTKALPPQEVAVALSQRKIPFVRQASYEEFKELFQVLRDNAQTKNSYLVLMVLSTIIATFGLFANSTPVVIGAMILAPLMSPIISLSMGALRQDRNLIVNSLITIGAGLGLSILFGIVLTWITPIQNPGTEILSRTRPNLLDLGIAVFSGIAGAYAHSREEVAKTLAGVAIAVALIPPLGVAAIGIGWADWSVFAGASLLLLTNLAGMVLAAAATFLVLGFSPVKLATKGILISTLLVIGLSIPLALGFNQMIYEHNIIKKLEGFQTEYAVVRDVNVQKIDPVQVSFRLVASRQLTIEEVDAVKHVIEDEIGEEVQIEVILALGR
jgi:uncharacterized hydrophobic protein (TIGR00271 family)